MSAQARRTRASEEELVAVVALGPLGYGAEAQVTDEIVVNVRNCPEDASRFVENRLRRPGRLDCEQLLLRRIRYSANDVNGRFDDHRACSEFAFFGHLPSPLMTLDE
jgi:hypothetical protein